jgi:uncharacterized protein YndB with AHSA1/START domain
MKKTDEPIVLEQLFPVNTIVLWNAITRLPEMTQWFFQNIEAFEPSVGFETRFIVTNQGRVFPHHWKITEAIPYKKIVYNWCYEGYKGNAIVCFELVEEGKNTLLRLTHTTTQDFPDNIPEFERAACIGGWNYFIKDRLHSYLKTKK